MADFRKYAVTVAGLACMLGAAGAASAQSFSGFTCNATATPFDMRAEGITEQAGDIVLTCTGGTVTPQYAQIPQVNITVSLNTNITSRLFSSSSGVSEALLLINEPPSGTQSFCPGASTSGQNLCLEYGLGSGGGSTTQTYNPLFPPPVSALSTPPAVATPRYNGVQGTYLGPTVGATNQLTFFGVPIDPPGPTVNVANAAGQISTFTPTLTLRITNIRANASQLGAPSGFSSSPVFETVSTSAGFPINNSVATVGQVRRGLIVTGVTNASQSGNTSSIGLGATSTFRTFQQCVSNALTTSSSSPALFGEQINFSEGFATSTKLRIPSSTQVAGLSMPGSILNSESQFVPSGPQGFDPSPGTSSTSGIGVANFATRIRIAFNSVQAGVTIYVPTTVTSNQGTEILSLTSSETGSISLVSASSTSGVPLTPTGQGFAALTVTSGSAVAIYEVTSQSTLAPSTIDTFSVPVLTTFTANPSANIPGLGASTVTVDFAPLSTNILASTNASTATIPRFVQTNTAAAGFTISPCSTVLLFPFLTNLAGFDTGLAIAATATDPFGTLAQSGICRLNFYGTAAPAQIPTGSITSGTVYTNLLSTLAPGFQGYMIAQCAFQYAHGFAFITDGFGGPGRGLSQGYLALIIPDPASNANSRIPSNTDYAPQSSGEGLTN